MGESRSARPAGGTQPEGSAGAILVLAEQSAAAIEASPGYDLQREGFAVAALRGLVSAGRVVIEEHAAREAGEC